MPDNEMLLEVAAARRFCRQVFQAAGVPEDDAAAVTENLIEGDLRGLGSHGISRVYVYCDRIRNGWVNKNPNVRILHDTPALLHLDGDNGLGAVVGTRAMAMCLDRASETGSAACSVQKGNHFGIASFYTMQAVRRDMIGLAAQNNPPNMAPWGGMTAMIGTNPFSIAVPAGRHRPMVMDMSSSIVARGKINLAEIEGRPIPEGWAIDKKGRPTTDATEALAGSVLPFGMHKGYAIALMVDVFTGILSGSAFSNHVGQLWGNNESIQNMGFFFSALDISKTIGVDAFKTRVDQLIDELKASDPVEGVEEILVPGEIEFRNAERNAKRGILIGPGVLRDLNRLREDFAIPMRLEDHIKPAVEGS
jgi:LDH2 family malate/lactate/ureidoglycolate dehydrogenase